MTTEFEFGRLVNRLSTGHALRNSMRWGFAMGTVGFQTSKAQADAIRRLCLRKLQATEYDDRGPGILRPVVPLLVQSD